jgi:hypothetical protein
MKIEINSVYSIKLVSGEEIVVKILEENAHVYTVSKPLTSIPAREGIQMMPTLFTANMDKEFYLNKSAISLIAETVGEVRDGYIGTTTGIKPVSNKILMG